MNEECERPAKRFIKQVGHYSLVFPIGQQCKLIQFIIPLTSQKSGLWIVFKMEQSG